jgi:hypothetical protein
MNHIRWFVLIGLLLLGASVEAAIRSVVPSGGVGSGTCISPASACTLTYALTQAAAGDEVVMANGAYSGTYLINGANGTSGAKITIRAANRHQAIFTGGGICSGSFPCDGSDSAFLVQRQYWIIQDLKFVNYFCMITIQASNVEVAHNILDHYGESGILADAGVNGGSTINPPTAQLTGVNIHHNAIAHGEPCNAGSWIPGIYLLRNVDSSFVIDNIITNVTDSGYTVGAKESYGLILAVNPDNNLVQGNMLLGAGTKGVFRILCAKTATQLEQSCDNNVVRDNAFLFGEGAISTDDCNDNATSFINNIIYGNYYANWYTKGNYDGTKGQHIFNHNVVVNDDFSRIGASFGDGGPPNCPASGYKRLNTAKDNILYGTSALANSSAVSYTIFEVRHVGESPNPILAMDHNLFWAPGSTSTWFNGYTLHATDIAATGSQPQFVNAAVGDFSLVANTVGTVANGTGGSDATDRGVAYNAFLKKSWLAHAFGLPTQEIATTGSTTATFTVLPNRHYQAWFYIPDTSPFNGTETFTVETVGGNQARSRDLNLIITGCGSPSCWIQVGGTRRWITLGRASSTDSTLTITRTQLTSASKMFIRLLPTADEAYLWITEASSNVPEPPMNLRIVSP